MADANRVPTWLTPTIYHGLTLRHWVKLLFDHAFDIQFRFIPRAISISCFAAVNSGLGVLQRRLYEKELDQIWVPDPIIVIGHWRSGTSWMHELLSLDPNHVYPTNYSCFAPTHFLLTQRVLAGGFDWIAPSVRPMDNMSVTWDRPQEDEFACMNLGADSPYLGWAFPNHASSQTDRAIDQNDTWEEQFEYFTKCLALHSPQKTPVLKSPMHSFRWRKIHQLFPGAKFVHVVREPKNCLASTINMWKRMAKTQGLQKHNNDDFLEGVFTTFVQMHESLREAGEELPCQNFLVVRYEDLVSDTAATINRVYDCLEIVPHALMDYSIRRYLRNARSTTPTTRSLENAPSFVQACITDLRSFYGYS